MKDERLIDLIVLACEKDLRDTTQIQNWYTIHAQIEK